MKEFETSDWVTLNHIIYSIYSIENLTDMRKIFLEQIKVMIDFDSAEFYIAGVDGTTEPESPVTYHCSGEQEAGRPYSFHLALGSDGEFLGVVMFYRAVDKGDFDYNDLFLLDILKDHLALRLAKERHEREKAGGKITISTAVKEYALTRREDTILRLLLAGLNNQEICEQLVISVNTLKKHVLNIYRKLGIRNRVQMFKMIKEKE